MTTLTKAWGAIRSSLEQNNSFYSIKNLVALAGLDVTVLSHLEQKPDKGATKGHLITAIDAVFSKMNEQERQQFITILTEELLKKDPTIQDQLEEHLSRHGWGVIDSRLVPLELFDPADLSQLPDIPRADLLKASQRFRDGDLGGAITAACGAVDTVTSTIYTRYKLDDPTKASFQERCNKAIEARQVLSDIENQLQELAWDNTSVNMLTKNLKGTLNHGAYVMQTLRSKMGDVHGTKPVLKPLVFDVLKWAELFVRKLSP